MSSQQQRKRENKMNNRRKSELSFLEMLKTIGNIIWGKYVGFKQDDDSIYF